MTVEAPASFATRPLDAADAAEAAELFRRFDAAHLDEVTDFLSEADVRDWWRSYDLDRESIGVFDREDALVAAGLLDRRAENALELDAYVHPRATGHGLGSFLLTWAEREARSRGSNRIRAVALAADAAAATLIETRGFQPVRHYYRMLIDLADRPAPARWPDGVVVAPLAVGEERTLYAVLEEAFADEWGRPQRSFEEWQHNLFGSETFDPSLCFIVREGDEPAAAVVSQRSFGIGWIATLGVRPPWRRRGLGEALLAHALCALYERGERRIGLGVDAENPTGATRLYERVGMRVAWQADVYEKELT